MKILVLDIETRPNMAYVWGLWKQNIGLNQIIEAGSVISFAAKWYGEKKIHFYSDFHDGHETMIKAAWDLMDAAEVIVHFNGKQFDIKHLNREFMLAGLTPPAPHKDLDLLSVVRSRFKFASNKLQHIANEVGIGTKVQHDGFDLWVRCMAQDAKAWDLMRRYNKQDVALTEQLYEQLRPWVRSHPNVVLGEGRPDNCPTCGSDRMQSRGVQKSPYGIYQRYHCQECGSWFKSRRRLINETAEVSGI